MKTNPDSALIILNKINPNHFIDDSNRAYFGLLFFQALERCYKPLQPDSVIDFSIHFYLKDKNTDNLAKCYFYKASIFKFTQQYDKATALYIKTLDCCKDDRDFLLMGKTLQAIGDINAIQSNYNVALLKYKQADTYLQRAGSLIDDSYNKLSIGRMYRLKKDNKTALSFYSDAISQTKDSMFLGVAYQEFGIYYYHIQKFDSAKIYLIKSLHFPYKGTNFSIRCFSLADLYFDIAKYDSAYNYATIALEHPANFYLKRDCYRILVNVEYLKNNIKQMGLYMSKYQDYTDSVRKVENQIKSSFLENLHHSEQQVVGTKRNMWLIVSILLIVLIVSMLVVYLLYHRNKLKKEQIELIKKQLVLKQEYVSRNLLKRIDETRISQYEARRSASGEERLKLDKELYDKCLHLNNWKTFSNEMNQSFNNIIEKLESEYSTINRKEISWCCFQLLEIPNADRILLLDSTPDGIYKVKQRIALKFNLKSTKDLDLFLKNLALQKEL